MDVQTLDTKVLVERVREALVFWPDSLDALSELEARLEESEAANESHKAENTILRHELEETMERVVQEGVSEPNDRTDSRKLEQATKLLEHALDVLIWEDAAMYDAWEEEVRKFLKK